MLPWLLRVWRVLPMPMRIVYLRVRYGRFAVGVAALIRDERGRILLAHRTYSREEPWALPGGWLEGRDDVSRTLERELMEETSLRVRAGPVVAVARSDFAIVLLLTAELLDGGALTGFRPSPEVSELAWVEPGDVSRLSAVNAGLVAQALGSGPDRDPTIAMGTP